MYCPTRKQELQKVFEESLRHHPPEQKQSAALNANRAAVGLLVRENRLSAELEFLLTLRSPHLNSHPGEVCLPGGQVENGDEWDLTKTLNREFFEEVGIAPKHIRWLNQPWDSLSSRAGIWVSPFLGFLDEDSLATPLVLGSEEVMKAEWRPLKSLMDPSLWHLRSLARALPGRPLQVLPIWQGFEPLVWGLTAGFLGKFVERISGRAPY